MQRSNRNNGNSAKEGEHRSSVLYQPLEEGGEPISFAEGNFNAKTMKDHKGTKPSNFEYWCRLIFAVILLLSVIGIPYLIMKMVNVQQDELGFIKRYNGEVKVCAPGSGMHWLDHVFPTDESKVFRFNEVKGCVKLGKAKFFQVSAGSLGVYIECGEQAPKLTKNGQFLYIDPNIEFKDVVENKEYIVKKAGMNLLNVPSDSFMGVPVGPDILLKKPGLYFFVDKVDRKLNIDEAEMHKNTEQYVRIGNHVIVRPPVNHWAIARELVHSTQEEGGSKYDFKVYDCKVEVDNANFSLMCFLPQGAQQEIEKKRESFHITLDNLQVGVKIEYQFRIEDPLKVIGLYDGRSKEIKTEQEAEAVTKKVIEQIHQKVTNLAKCKVLQLVQHADERGDLHGSSSKMSDDMMHQNPSSRDLQGVLDGIRHLLMDEELEKSIAEMLSEHGIGIDKFVITDVVLEDHIREIMNERFDATNAAYIAKFRSKAQLEQAKTQKDTKIVNAEAQAESAIISANNEAKCVEIAAIAQAKSITIKADGESKAIVMKGQADTNVMQSQSEVLTPDAVVKIKINEMWSSASENALKGNSKFVLSSGSGGQGLGNMVTAVMANSLLSNQQAVGHSLSLDAERGQAVQLGASKTQSGTSDVSLNAPQNMQTVNTTMSV